MTTTEQLPLSETITPESEVEVCDVIANAATAGTPIYTLGGGTSLDMGLVPTTPGIGLSTSRLNQLVDYPARDMTITAQAGMTFDQLAHTLASERQRLPIDPPQAELATLGGILATNTSGPRRFGCGTIRDYVIGISAVDGRGKLFHGGGRVVKNVAGYDFCRLLVGSLGTLGVITQLTFKVVPIPERSAFVSCVVDDWNVAETLLADLIAAPLTPTAVQLARCSALDEATRRTSREAAALVVGLEGTVDEVQWMRETLKVRWNSLSARSVEMHEGHQADELWQQLIEFPVAENPALTLKANLPPSQVAPFCHLLQSQEPEAQLLADGGGQVLAKFATMPADPARLLLHTLQPAAARSGGQVAVVQLADPTGWTRQTLWGGRSDADDITDSIRRQFDPQAILNRGRWGT